MDEFEDKARELVRFIRFSSIDSNSVERAATDIRSAYNDAIERAAVDCEEMAMSHDAFRRNRRKGRSPTCQALLHQAARLRAMKVKT